LFCGGGGGVGFRGLEVIIFLSVSGGGWGGGVMYIPYTHTFRPKYEGRSEPALRGWGALAAALRYSVTDKREGPACPPFSMVASVYAAGVRRRYNAEKSSVGR